MDKINQNIQNEKTNYNSITTKTIEIIFMTNELLKITGIKIKYLNNEITLIDSIKDLGHSYIINEKIFNLEHITKNTIIQYDNKKYIELKTLDGVFILEHIYLDLLSFINPNFTKILNDLNNIVKNIKKIK